MANDRTFTCRLTLEYDGSRFSGWQTQKNADRTVMGELKAALVNAGFPPLDLGGAGRTDAGVHALAQVAHLRLARRAHTPSLAIALNYRLPATIHVLSAEAAPDSFHARHDATARSYLYQISRRRTAFAKPFVWWVKDPLDLGRLRRAAHLLSGRRRDFAHFTLSRAARQAREAAESTLVDILGVEVAEAGDLVLLRFVASHFLWRMVRRLVGSLVAVGTGELAEEDFATLLEAGPVPAAIGDPGRFTAPASGLFLERVLYQGDPPLPPLAAVTPVPHAPAGGAPTGEMVSRPAPPARPQPGPARGGPPRKRPAKT